MILACFGKEIPLYNIPDWPDYNVLKMKIIE